jgi:ABC-type multidrug transport system fused ATPase/permease subunit
MINAIYKKFESFINPFTSPRGELVSSELMHSLWYFVRQAKGIIFAMLALGLATAFLDVFVMYSIGKFIDIISAIKSPGEVVKQYSWELVVFGCIIFLIRPGISILNNLISDQGFRSRFSALVRWQSYLMIIKKDMSFFHETPSGKLASTLWQSGQSATEVIMAALQVIWANLVYMIFVFSLLMLIDYKFIVVVVCWLTAYTYISKKYIPETKRKAKSSAEASNTTNGLFVDVFTNITTVKVFSPTGEDREQVKLQLSDFIRKSSNFLRIITSAESLLVIISAFSFFSISSISIFEWSKGNISGGDIAVVFALFTRLESMLFSLMSQLTNVLRAAGVFQSTMAVLTQPTSINDEYNAKDIEIISGGIEFRNVTFGYLKDRPILNDINLTIQPGEKVGVVGASGSGKSTLVNLLLRFYDPQSGEIIIDNVNIKDITQSSLRAGISIVSQDSHLFNRSVFDNIHYGRNNATTDEVTFAAKISQSFNFIKELRDKNTGSGFNVYVGERGVALSGGQKQRICIARAILKNAPILLLDEATSSLDSKTENLLSAELITGMANKTVISIAHRLSTVVRMDKIIVMSCGRIVEQGSHNELLEMNGVYADLWRQQHSKHGQTEVRTVNEF